MVFRVRSLHLDSIRIKSENCDIRRRHYSANDHECKVDRPAINYILLENTHKSDRPHLRMASVNAAQLILASLTTGPGVVLFCKQSDSSFTKKFRKAGGSA